MSPPRRTTAPEMRDPLERILDKLDALEREFADVKQTLERRLAPLEAALSSIADHEARLKRLEEAKARAEGAIWLGRIGAILLGGGVEWALSHFTH